MLEVSNGLLTAHELPCLNLNVNRLTSYSAGTNTDAVLLDPTKSGPSAVITSYKAITGRNVTTGIEEAIRTLLRDANVESASVASLMIGTTVGLA